MVEKKPFPDAGLEDVGVKWFRRQHHEAKYWTARALDEAGSDSRRYEVCKAQETTWLAGLGAALKSVGNSGYLVPPRRDGGDETSVNDCIAAAINYLADVEARQ